MSAVEAGSMDERRYEYDSEEASELGKATSSDEEVDNIAEEDEVAAAADENYFPRILAVFYSIFHPTKGPTVVCQVPEGSIETSQLPDTSMQDELDKGDRSGRSASIPSVYMEPASFKSKGVATAKMPNSPPQQHEALFDFKNLSEYIIPRAPLCGRLITYTTTSDRGESYKILSHPMLLTDQLKYPRNTFIFNLAFVFDGRADVRAYEPIARKCARELRDLERNSSFLSRSQFRMYGVIEQLFEDLNSYYESFVALPDAPHTKYISEAAKTAELLREGKRVSPPKLSQDTSLGSPSGRTQERSPSTSSSSSGDRVIRMTAFASIGQAASDPVASSSFPPLKFRDILSKPESPHGLGRRVRDAINVKLFPTYTNPKDVHDWDVPVMLLDLGRRTSDNWDLTMRKVLPFIDGVNHVKRIAQLADADLELTRQCIEHLLYYRCIIMIDAFQFSNQYTVRPTIATLADDEVIVGECAAYVTKRGYPLATWPKLLSLYSSLRPSLTLNDWIEENDIDGIGIDVRRFVTFGVIKGFLRRVHRYPILLLGEAGAQLERKSILNAAGDHTLSVRHEIRSRSPKTSSPAVAITGEGLSVRDTSESPNRLRSTASPAGEDPMSPYRFTSPERVLSPSRRSADRQEVSDDFAWMGTVFTATREGSVTHSRSVTDGNKSGSVRRRGLPHAPSAQLAHHHRPTRATVMDVANVAFDVALKESSIGETHIRLGGGQRVKQLTLRTPRPRGQSSSTIRESVATGGRREGNTEEDGRGIGSGKPAIPKGFVEMLDGTLPDDAFCVRFGRSWNEILQLLVYIGMTLPAYASDATHAGHSAFSLRRGAGGGRSSIDVRADSPATDQVAAADDSGFPQMSGIWAAPGLPGRKTSAQNLLTLGTPKNVSFPSLPRYRQHSVQGQPNEDIGRTTASDRSGFTRYPQQDSSYVAERDVGEGRSAKTQTSQRRGSASFLLPLPEEFGFHERQRILNGDLGSIQIIIK